MLRTWTDTHYRLEQEDWLYITTHEEHNSASLVCPGYARDGEGFSIHFTTDHIEMLEKLLGVLRILKTQEESLFDEYQYPHVSPTGYLVR